MSLVFAIAGGCDADFVQSGPVRICAEAGVQCMLPEGPLGVCERMPCGGGGGDTGEDTGARGAEGPCFVCTPQH